MSDPQLRVGAARVDITPDYGTQISGDIGRYRPVEEIRDRLYARIVLIESGGVAACVIACDMACAGREPGLRIRSMVGDIVGAPPENVMLHCTQSHSAARLGGMFEDPQGVLPPELWWVRGETPAYTDLFARRVREGAEEAAQRLVPARARFSRAIEARAAFNRRFVMRDGSAKTHPANCDENILYCEGPIDPEASLTLFETLDAKPVAGLLHYTCHPTHGYPHRYISADWPGLWSESMRERLGGECVVGCINGACGNISPTDHTNPDFVHGKSLETMLGRLAQTGEKLIANLKDVAGTPVRTTSDILSVPWLHLTPEAAEKARNMIRDHPEPIFLDDKRERISWDWVFAMRDLDRLHRIATSPECGIEIQAFRVGDVVLVGWPGEPFVEAQLEVKLNSRAPFTIIGHECNGDGEYGYIPTLKAYPRGGYETWGVLPPGTLEKMAERSVSVIGGLFD